MEIIEISGYTQEKIENCRPQPLVIPTPGRKDTVENFGRKDRKATPDYRNLLPGESG